MIRNVILGLFTKGAVALLMLLSLVVCTRNLGSVVFGEYSLLLLNVAIVHALTEIYSGSALVYFIPQYSFARIYRFGWFWILGCALLLSGLIFLFNGPSRSSVLHLLLLSALTALNGFHNFLLLGRERIRLYNLLLFLQPAIFLCVLSYRVFIMEDHSLLAPVISLYAAQLSVLALSGWVLSGMVNGQNGTGTFSWKEILRKGSVNQLGNLAHILSNRYNYYVIAAVSVSLTGIYASSTSLVEAIWFISAGISPLVLTHVANARDAGNETRLTLRMAILSLTMSSACVLLLYFVPAEFFTWLLGKDFSAVKKVMLYLSPGVLMISFSSIISHYFSGRGDQHILLRANASGLLVTLVSSYFLVKHYGLAGACLAASLAYAVQSLVLCVHFFRTFKPGSS